MFHPLLRVALALALITPAAAQSPGIAPSGFVYGNSTASSAQPSYNSMTAMLNRAFCTVDNSVLVRLAGAWACLPSANSAMWATSASGVPSITSTPVLGGTLTINNNASALQAPNSGSRLQVGSADNIDSRLTVDAFGTGFPILDMRRTRGTAAARTAVQSGDVIGAMSGFGFDGTNYALGTSANMLATQTWTAGARGTQWRIGTITRDTATYVERLGIEDTGAILVPPTVTGGSQGAGTVNASGLFVSGVAVPTTASIRTKLTTNTTYNVPSTYATVCAALTFLSQSIDGAGYNVTIQVADGTSAQTSCIVPVIVGIAAVTIQGNASNKALVEFTTASTFSFQWQVPQSTIFFIKNLTLNYTGATAAQLGIYHGNTVALDNIAWKCTAGAGAIAMQSTSATTVNYQNAHSFTDTCTSSSALNVGDLGFVSLEPSFVGTIVGTPTYATFVNLYRGGVLSAQNATFVNGAGAAGFSYLVNGNSVIDLTGLVGTFPGTAVENDGSGVIKLSATTGTSVKGQFLGTTTNDNAVAGRVGEYIEATVASASAIILTTGAALNMTSISLTAGDWDVTGAIYFNLGGATSITRLIASLSTTTNTLNLAPGYFADWEQAAAVPGGNQISKSVSSQRFSLASTTTIYLVGFAVFTAGPATEWGKLSARRVR